MQATYHIKVLCLVLCNAFAGRALVEAATDFYIPFRYRLATNGQDFGGAVIFPNACYSSSEDCPAHHRTPDGQMYVHGHTIEAFSFSYYNASTGTLDWVTA